MVPKFPTLLRLPLSFLIRDDSFSVVDFGTLISAVVALFAPVFRFKIGSVPVEIALIYERILLRLLCLREFLLLV